MHTIFKHIRTFIIRGLLGVIPIVLTVLALQFLYVFVDRRVVVIIDDILGLSFPGLGVLIVLVILYLLGLLVSNMVGKKALHVIELFMNRIPIIRTTYQVGKQLSTTLSLPETSVFKRAILVEYLKPGIWTIGFVTGVVIDRENNDERLLKVFIPTPPNPTSGTMVIVKETMTRDPGWTIQDAIKAVISGGIIGPDVISPGTGEP